MKSASSTFKRLFSKSLPAITHLLFMLLFSSSWVLRWHAAPSMNEMVAFPGQGVTGAGSGVPQTSGGLRVLNVAGTRVGIWIWRRDSGTFLSSWLLNLVGDC